ncbi:MAG TPA: GTP 3',8-cyclase MoaA [Lacipirellulaceae bacterium]|nr:GTP 3',8-cyclase MoaA [Lacipirellulaceae bacterium]
MISNSSPLIDTLGRVHTSLRISVTDRCNIRCFYCMPNELVRFRPRDEILTFEEITRFVRVVSQMGVRRLRLTGGEPLVRTDLPRLVEELASLPGIEDLALTTNGILLPDLAAELRSAGLVRLNISLDTLREDVFQKITRREGVDRVLAGIAAAQDAGFTDIRLNAVAIHGLTEDEIIPLARFARQRNLELRFIEYMPLDAEQNWQSSDVLDGDAVRRILEDEFGPLTPVNRRHASQPATDFEYSDSRGRVGLIQPVSQPFCQACDRLRLTAEGQVRNCLFSTAEWDARAILRRRAGSSPTPDDDDDLADLVRDCVRAKAPAHGIGAVDFVRPQRAMYQIGG